VYSVWCTASTWSLVRNACSFSKFKLIESYLRSVAQDRLDNLALMSIENEAAGYLDSDELVDKFANIKVRREEF
jgi:hypothetical protein